MVDLDNNIANNPTQLEKIFAAGDSWLMNNGIVTPITHNNIILNLYANFPIEYVEYMMHPTDRTIEVILYLKWWRFLTLSRDKLIDKAFELLAEYLKGYKITVRVKRYKKSVKSREVTEENPF